MFRRVLGLVERGATGTASRDNTFKTELTDIIREAVVSSDGRCPQRLRGKERNNYLNGREARREDVTVKIDSGSRPAGLRPKCQTLGEPPDRFAEGFLEDLASFPGKC